MIELRHYQRAALDTLYAYFARHAGHPVLVLPTGSGKSLIIAGFVREVLGQWPSQRILVVTHVKELVEQNALKLFQWWPEAPAGVYAAGLNRRDVGDAITFASIQSVYRRAHELGSYDLILVDEAHLIPPGSEGMYRTFFAGMEALNPDVRIVGLTATPFRLGHGMLHEGKGALFTDIAYEVGIGELLADGYLAPLTTAPVRERLKVSEVGKRGGEFIAGALEAAVDREAVTQKACAEIVELGRERRAWLLFCSGIKHAGHVTDALAAQGIACALVTGETPTRERDRLVSDFRAGKLRALVNVDVLTTGFDAPQTDLLAFLRPTQSPGLYLQMAGRGMRIAPDKTDCLVLDFAGNIARHGPVDDVRPPAAPGTRSGGDAPAKVCPKCRARMHPRAEYCADCGYEFPAVAAHAAQADAAPILKRDAAGVRYDDLQFLYSRYDKLGEGGRPSLLVEYHAGMRRVAREWICLEHDGYARTKARLWWKRRAGPMSEPPATINDALERIGELAEPRAIVVDERGKYPEILGVEFDEQPDTQREGIHAGDPAGGDRDRAVAA